MAVGCGKSTEKDQTHPVPKTTNDNATNNTTNNTTNNDDKPPQKPMTDMKPTASGNFEAGHPLTPATDLLAWIETNAKTGDARTLFKLPVVVVFKDEFRMSVSKAFVGISTDDSGDDKLALRLDDGGLGVGLFDQLNSKCDKNAKACVVWLEGHSGPHIDAAMPEPPGTAPGHEFAIRKVGALVSADDSGAQAMIAK